MHTQITRQTEEQVLDFATEKSFSVYVGPYLRDELQKTDCFFKKKRYNEP